MLVKNIEKVVSHENLFYCKNNKIKAFLQKRKIPYINIEEGYCIYAKTPMLDKALSDWKKRHKKRKQKH